VREGLTVAEGGGRADGAVRTGRRPGGSETRQAILRAARAAFGDAGYDGATIRGIAAAAGVDPALVHHYYGSKDTLFAAAMTLPFNPAEILPRLLGPGVDGLGERILRMFLAVWDSPEMVSPFFAVLRGAMSHERSAAMLREFITAEVLGKVVDALDVERPELRAALMGSQLIGLGMARYVVKVPPLPDATHDELVAAVAPTLQRYLTGPLD
jgi:AcrR family transcriptional regulator